MYIHKSHLPAIISTFIENHVVAKATGWEAVACGALSYLAKTKSEQILQHPKVHEWTSLFNIIDDKDMVDMNYLREMAIYTVNTTNGKFPPLMGYILDSSDIETIYNLGIPYQQERKVI